MTALWVAVVAAVGALGMGAFAFFRSRAARVPWQRLPSGDSYLGTVDPDRLLKALAQARKLLARCPGAEPHVWDPVGVRVRATNAWVDDYGRTVGGESIGPSIEVGSDLSALCHELAHVLELRALGGSDGTHSTWDAKGFWAADREYRAWLTASVA